VLLVCWALVFAEYTGVSRPIFILRELFDLGDTALMFSNVHYLNT
jgi:hypothetical protein